MSSVLKSELDLLRRIRDCKNGILEIPSGSYTDISDDLRSLERAKLVELKLDHRNHPGMDLYVLTHAGKEAIEASDEEVKQRAELKKSKALDRTIPAIVGAFVMFVLDRLPQIIAFFRSLFHR